MPQYTPVGPPATLNAVAFAGNGVIYGTVDRGPVQVSTRPGGALAQRRPRPHLDGGVSHALRNAAHVVQVSPADPDMVYAYASGVPRGSGQRVVRIDVGTGRGNAPAVQPHAGRGWGGHGVRPPRSQGRPADRPLPPHRSELRGAPHQASYASDAIVDPNSSACSSRGLPPGSSGAEASTDGGTTWADGARLEPVPRPIAFAGPRPARSTPSPPPCSRLARRRPILSGRAPAPPGTVRLSRARPRSRAEPPTRVAPPVGALSFTGDDGATYSSVPLSGSSS